ncbi:MAG: ROK family transcriptional regulator [Anaerolineae bacterium]|nr:ROK family transcriptional regulator [Anaerolineae bacterium]
MKKIVPRQTVKASVMRSINRSAILDIIRENSPISRSYIANVLNVSLPTVMRVVDILIEEGLVRHSGTKEASGGRPRPLLEFNGSAFSVLAVDLSGTKMFGMVADLSGNIQHEIHVSEISPDPQTNLERLYQLIEELIKTPRPPHQTIRGIGIGAPGITNHQEGIVHWAPSLGWRDLPLKQLLNERFQLPVLVENDVNLAALGEFGFGAGRSAQSMVCISVGSGIGAGIVIGGSLHRGYHYAAGEVGYLLPGVEFLGKSYQTFGALESLASSTAIAQQANQLCGTSAEDSLRAEDIFIAVRNGEKRYQPLIARMVDYLSLAVAAATTLIDPEMIVLGGSISEHADLLIPSILQRLNGAIPTQPNLIVSSLGTRATIMGAIMLVLNGTMETLVVERH